MLVLSRFTGEHITITTSDGEIVVELVESRRGLAKLGITAPEHVTVHRGEVQDRIDREAARREGGGDGI